MEIGKTLKKIREKQGLLQKQFAAAAKIDASNYNKIESGEREPSIQVLNNIASFLGMTIDEIIHFKGNIPQEPKLIDKSWQERLQVAEELSEEEKIIVYKFIDSIVSNSRLRKFVKQNESVFL